MLDYGEAPSSPASASPLNAAWLRMTGKDNWIPTTATVYSTEFADLPDTINSEVGHYHVTYTYTVSGVVYIGRFSDLGRQDESYFKRDDTFLVRYNPHFPAKSYYPALRTQTNFRLIFFGIGAALALLVSILSALSHR